MSPQDSFGPQNDPKMMSKLPQNGTVGKRNHSNTSRHLREGWNREGNPKVVSEKNWQEFRPCRSHFFVAKRRQSTQRARKMQRKIGESSVYVNGRPFVCTVCTEQMRKLCQKIGEHSVHVHDCFTQCIGHTVHSEQRAGSAAWCQPLNHNKIIKLARVPQHTVLQTCGGVGACEATR